MGGDFNASGLWQNPLPVWYLLMPSFRKYAIISTETSTSSSGRSELRRFSWLDLQTLDNLADYDALIIDLTALGATPATHVFANLEIDKLFDVTSWVSVLEAGGLIVILGEPATQCSIPAPPLPPTLSGSGPFPIHRAHQRSPNTTVIPLQRVLSVVKDQRPFDFRRIIREEETNYINVYRYLDQVGTWNYSLRNVQPSAELIQALLRRQMEIKSESIAETKFGTFLAAHFTFSARNNRGYLTLLPASGRGPGSDAHWVLREFFDIDTHVPPPRWTEPIKVPGQLEIDAKVAANKATIATLQQEINVLENDRARGREWLRLLYDDGFGLEEIVQRCFTTLGAKVTKPSREKHDCRITVEGYPAGILEIKGTHNGKFAIGSLRQLANWVDEALEHGGDVKGIFVGNAARTKAVQSRDLMLFETNSERLAQLRKLAVIRTTDLYCVTILAALGQLDADKFWEKLFSSNGALDVSHYWRALPKEYQPS